MSYICEVRRERVGMELDMQSCFRPPRGPPRDETVFEGVLGRNDLYPLRTHYGPGTPGERQDTQWARGVGGIEVECVFAHFAHFARFKSTRWSMRENVDLPYRPRIRAQATTHGALDIERARIIGNKQNIHALGCRLCSKKK